MAKLGENALRDSLASIPGQVDAAIKSGLSPSLVTQPLAESSAAPSPSLEDRVAASEAAPPEMEEGMSM